MKITQNPNQVDKYVFNGDEKKQDKPQTKIANTDSDKRNMASGYPLNRCPWRWKMRNFSPFLWNIYAGRIINGWNWMFYALKIVERCRNRKEKKAEMRLRNYFQFCDFAWIFLWKNICGTSDNGTTGNLWIDKWIQWPINSFVQFRVHQQQSYTIFKGFSKLHTKNTVCYKSEEKHNEYFS